MDTLQHQEAWEKRALQAVAQLACRQPQVSSLSGRYRPLENGDRNTARPYTVPVPCGGHVGGRGAMRGSLRTRGGACGLTSRATRPRASRWTPWDGRARDSMVVLWSIEPRGCWGKPGQGRTAPPGRVGPGGARTRWQGQPIFSTFIVLGQPIFSTFQNQPIFTGNQPKILNIPSYSVTGRSVPVTGRLAGHSQRGWCPLDNSR